MVRQMSLPPAAVKAMSSNNVMAQRAEFWRVNFGFLFPAEGLRCASGYERS